LLQLRLALTAAMRRDRLPADHAKAEARLGEEVFQVWKRQRRLIPGTTDQLLRFCAAVPTARKVTREALEAVLRDQRFSNSARCAAAKALGHLGDPEALEAVLRNQIITNSARRAAEA